MSFAGPDDGMLRDMLAKAHARCMVLSAAVGQCRSALAAALSGGGSGRHRHDRDRRRRQAVAAGQSWEAGGVAAPGVMVLEPAPGAGYQVTTGTSVAAAAALLLARNPNLTPDQVRAVLSQSARAISGRQARGRRRRDRRARRGRCGQELTGRRAADAANLMENGRGGGI